MKNWLVHVGVCAAVLAVLAGQPRPARAQLIVNGGFELPVVVPSTFQTFTPGQTIGSAWTVLGNAGTNVLLIETTYSEPLNNVGQFNAQELANSVDLTGASNVGPSAGVRQTVATTLGQQYTLSFFVGRVTPNGGPAGVYATPATVDLSIDGGARIPFTNSDITNNMVKWKEFSYTITGTGNNMTIDFLNGTSGSNFAGLDNVSLAAIPEPSTMVISTLGALCLLGCAWRRRKSVQPPGGIA